MSIHTLKTWPPFWEAVASGVKTVEIRLDDRGFSVGDVLVLREWDVLLRDFTGRSCERLVTHVLCGERWGLREKFVALSLAPWPTGGPS